MEFDDSPISENYRHHAFNQENTMNISISKMRIFQVRWLAVIAVTVLMLALAYNPAISFADTWGILFADDFESGVGPWELDSGWSIIDDGGNNVLQGSGHSWAYLPVGEMWTDYRFEARVKLVRQEIHLNVRMNDRGRYFIGLHEGGVVLNKQYWPDVFLNDLLGAKFFVAPGEWHMVEITAKGNRIQIAVDGIDRVEYFDIDDPFLNGTIALETIHDGKALSLVDDVFVEGEALPEPPACPKEPGTRSMGFYKTHPMVVMRALELVGEPEAFDIIMDLLWKNKTAKGKQQILILDRAHTVLGMNERVFTIGQCTLRELGLDGDSSVSKLRDKSKRLIEDIDWKNRDYKKEPLTSKEKEELADLSEIIDAVNNSNADAPLPRDYDDVAQPAQKGKKK
jgi:hypothetical protein